MARRRQEPVLEKWIDTLQRGGKRARIEAIHALGKLDDPRAVPHLVSALKAKDRDVRALAMGKLCFLNKPSIVPGVVKALDDSDPRVRQHAIYALQRMKARTTADRIAAMMTGDKNEIVRFNAALALAEVGGRRHKAAFVRALGDRNTNVVVTALRALARSAPREIAGHVLRLARDARRWGRIPQAQRDVIFRLLKGSLANKQVVALLREVVADEVAEAERSGTARYSMEAHEAACLLAERDDATGVPVLLAMLKGGEYSQERSCRALALLKERSAVPVILEHPLRNGFYPVMLKAVRALGEIGDARALPALASFFNDRVDDFPVERSLTFTKDDPDLRLTALVAIRKIASQTLLEATRSADAFERKLARRLEGAA